MYLLDSDWIIQALANREPALSTLERLASSRIYVSYITVAEIYERAFESVNPEAHLLTFRQFLSPYRTLTLSDPIVERFAEVRSVLRRRGQLIPDFDLLIGATALHHELTVLTFNRRDFERIPDLRIYQPG
jgi:tRNA(fMet)-specific endonuclease VapC